ncbi:MAG TPA: SDR family oxidoreductase [Acidimicrobiales bacterium]|jgi:NAD(P)-dependent dehydrogenase (short-subunit alcohol dehydrogenase family)|nr:SDR family oxidoreductase [Acidimicrobiales bacterium]
MGFLDGRVAIVTGAARGLGREHALLFASEGAQVVVNDRPDSSHSAAEVVDQIKALGGEAVLNTDDVSDWEAGRRLIETAVGTFGDVHVLVNNAGILRDRLIFNMSEEEWDTVIDIDLKGHFVPLRHAAAYWRDRAKAGDEVRACVINTSSTSGLIGNPGQTNYGAAKAGVGALTLIAAEELGRYGIRVNAIAPAARTRLTESTPGLGDMVAPPDDPERFDEWDPANASPLVAWLAGADCPVTGSVFYCFGGTIAPMTGWSRRPGISRSDRWTIDAIAAELPAIL